MIAIEDTEIGVHYWAKMYGDLIIVLKDMEDSFIFCEESVPAIGPRGMKASGIEIISVIEKPYGFEALNIYSL